MAKMYMSKSELRMEDEKSPAPIRKMEQVNLAPMSGKSANFTESINNNTAPTGHEQNRNTMDQMAPHPQILDKNSIKKLLSEI